MDTSVISAFAALAGAAIGGFTSLVAALVSHRVQAKAERLAHDQLRRQELYKEFIEQASELYIHALQNDKPKFPP
jgi:sugar (pentulose or hexulose) kinase